MPPVALRRHVLNNPILRFSATCCLRPDLLVGPMSTYQLACLVFVVACSHGHQLSVCYEHLSAGCSFICGSGSLLLQGASHQPMAVAHASTRVHSTHKVVAVISVYKLVWLSICKPADCAIWQHYATYSVSNCLCYGTTNMAHP